MRTRNGRKRKTKGTISYSRMLSPTQTGRNGAAPTPSPARKATRRLPHRPPEPRSVWDQMKAKVRGALKAIRRSQDFLDVYEREINRELVRPVSEIAAAHQRIRRLQQSLREWMKGLEQYYDKEGTHGKPIADTAYDSDGLDVEQVECAVCGKSDSTETNDILFCDRAGCDRAFHQLCLDPPVTTPNVDLPDDWFCPACDCLLDCLDLINYELEEEWESADGLFPDVPDYAEDLANEAASAVLATEESGDSDAPPKRKAGSRARNLLSVMTSDPSVQQWLAERSDVDSEEDSDFEAEEDAVHNDSLEAIDQLNELANDVDGSLSDSSASSLSSFDESVLLSDALGKGKRKRKPVSYLKLADEMVGRGGGKRERDEGERGGSEKEGAKVHTKQSKAKKARRKESHSDGEEVPTIRDMYLGLLPEEDEADSDYRPPGAGRAKRAATQQGADTDASEE